ncbi:alcohol dehydrogenase catalytic domain-containing protein [Sphingobium herbicidovorans]
MPYRPAHGRRGTHSQNPTRPFFIPGHEGVGHVAAVGAGVTHVKEGDQVSVPSLYTACGHCVHCLGGWETLCHEQAEHRLFGQWQLAEYVLANPNYVGHLPDNVDFLDIAPILCAGVTIYKGLKATEAQPGEWVVVEIGGLSHMAVQYAVPSVSMWPRSTSTIASSTSLHALAPH